MQFVAEVDRRRFYNDSLATTAESVAAALESFTEPVVLLAGGYDKQIDLQPLADTISEHAKAVALMGQTAEKLHQLLGDINSVIKMSRCSTFDDAFRWAVAESSPGKADRGRYGDTATEAIIWLLSKLEPNPGEFTACIYGGASVIGHLGRHGDIGLRNIEVAKQTLKKHAIKITEEDVGGTLGRRIYFDTGSGQVTVKIIQKTQEVERLAKRRESIATQDTRILIVDDSALVRKILRQAIEETPGMEVCGEAEDAYQARDMVLSEDPDVISLDIIMPKMDGFTMLRQLKDAGNKTTIIVLSNLGQQEDIDKAKELGVADYMVKSNTPISRIVEVVNSILQT